MADFDTGDVVRLGCVLKFDGLYDIVNVYHVKILSGGNLPFATASLDYVEYCDALYAFIAEKQVNNITPGSIGIKNITQNTVWGNVAFDVYAGGSSTADSVALQVALLAWGRTSISRVQIRKYLGVFSETDIADGLWIATLRGVCETMMAYHITAQTMTEGQVLQGCAYSLSLARVTFALSATTSEVPVIQRRRRQGRGS